MDRPQLFHSLVSVRDAISGMVTPFQSLILPSQTTRRIYNFGAGGHRKNWNCRFCYFAVILLFICTSLVIGHGYFNSSFPGQGFIPSSQLNDINNYGDSSNGGCDIFHGKWVYDKTYPLYNASVCPFVEQGFRCQLNGRRDEDYMKWRWQPLNCHIPRFNAPDILNRLQGQRVAFVGDSMARTQWESLICLLMQGVADKRSVYEVNGNRITKRIRFLGVRFSSFNFTIEYYRSPFLVRQGSPPKHVPKRVQSTLKLDRLDAANKRWLEADLLIFNSGHWWTPTKTFQM